jgi:hypothetical protein
VQHFTGSDDELVLKEPLCQLVAQGQFAGRFKHLGCHDHALAMPVHILAFVAEFGHLRQHHASDETLPGPKAVSQGRALLEDISPVTDGVQVLEDRVDAVVPLDFSLTQLVVSVEEVSKLMEGLDQHEVLLSLSQELDALFVAP